MARKNKKIDRLVINLSDIEGHCYCPVRRMPYNLNGSMVAERMGLQSPAVIHSFLEFHKNIEIRKPYGTEPQIISSEDLDQLYYHIKLVSIYVSSFYGYVEIPWDIYERIEKI